MKNMTNKDYTKIGYVKFEGHSVESGIFDVRKSAEVLLGFDDMLRFFIKKDYPEINEREFELPVKIGEGSWVIDLIVFMAITIPSIAIGSYVKTYTSEIAKNDVKDKTTKQILENVMNKIIWKMRIAKHMGEFSLDKFEKVKWRNNNAEVGIINKDGVDLYVPSKIFNDLKEIPKNLFSRIVMPVDAEKTLSMGVYNTTNKININNVSKKIFYVDDIDEQILPELEDDMPVELKGTITKINEKWDTIGFEYKSYILSARPENGNLTSFKNKMISKDTEHYFPKAIIKGKITRRYKNGSSIEKKPQIIFNDIIPVELKTDKVRKLF